MQKSSRVQKKYAIEVNSQLKKKAVYWADNKAVDMIWLDSNQYADDFHRYEAILAFSPHSLLKENVAKGAFDTLKSYINTTKDWIFGYLSYDLKNDIEKLHSKNVDELNFPEIYFFQPQKMIFFEENELIFSYLPSVSHEMDSDFEKIKHFCVEFDVPNSINVDIKSRISKEDYLKQVSQMKEHIAKGDIYEANFCQEFYAENAEIHPLNVYWQLNQISEPPFACFMKIQECFVMSASPERYLQRIENQVVSQPIKGTAKRSTDKETDEKLRSDLAQNPKERSENIMIVDLVRNDLSLYAQRGSVQVTELCKPYTFKQVHQLISTIKVEVKADTQSVDVVRSTFPMGSMTGAPKISAMQIIEKLEQSKRGIYSGAIGYFTPSSDFDFNVVIRSIFYNNDKKYLSFSVGSAITANSDPEKEYEECLVKAQAMKQVLSS